jgi:hypothetical protein
LQNCRVIPYLRLAKHLGGSPGELGRAKIRAAAPEGLQVPLPPPWRNPIPATSSSSSPWLSLAPRNPKRAHRCRPPPPLLAFPSSDERPSSSASTPDSFLPTRASREGSDRRNRLLLPRPRPTSSPAFPATSGLTDQLWIFVVSS